MDSIYNKSVKFLKLPARVVKGRYTSWRISRYVAGFVKHQNIDPASFEYPRFRQKLLHFIENMKFDKAGLQYRYSASCSKPTLYSSVYACMTYGLLGETDKWDAATKASWVRFFDAYQREDGLFYDPVVKNEIYDDSDWWGARHLALHIINAYTCLQARPKYPFTFLKKYYNKDAFYKELSENSDMFEGAMENDFDNKLMNIYSLLQYQRDAWGDTNAGNSIRFLQEYLLEKINPLTGIWGDNNIENAAMRSRKVQFAYHLLPVFFYDDIYTFDLAKIVDVVVKTKNNFGGFGVAANSSACEDIDSMDILIKISKHNKQFTPIVTPVLTDAFKWVLTNQMADGGFVFRLNEEFVYGHEQMRSEKNQGAMFPSWFRTLSLAYANEVLHLSGNFTIQRCPGL